MNTAFNDAVRNARKIPRQWRALQRELDIYEPARIVPMPLFCIAVVPSQSPQTYLEKFLHQRLARTISPEAVVQSPYPLFEAPLAELSQEKHELVLKMFDDLLLNNVLATPKLAKELEAMRRAIMNRQTTVPCMYVGDLMKGMELLKPRRPITFLSRTAVVIGEGREAIDMWRRVNALPDWSYLFPDNPDKRYPKKPRRRPAENLAWQPAPVGAAPAPV